MLIFILILANARKEYGSCIDESQGQSPIQIKPPFAHIDLELEFEFLEARDIFMKNTGSELQVPGAYGFIKHNGRMFNAYMVKFKSPSEHSISENDYFYPLEMQIFFISSDKFKIAISILFTTNKDHTEDQLLAKFGFGMNIIKGLQFGDVYKIPNPISLGELFGENEKFFVYQGSDTFPPCEQMIWLILFKFYKLSTNQAIDYPEMLLFQVREQKEMKRPIYTNFDPVLFVVMDYDTKTKEELKKQRNQHQVDKKLVKDNFSIIGGVSNLDGFVFMPPGFQPGKVVKTEDYFVIKVKPEPKDPQSEKEEEIQAVAEPIVDDIDKNEELVYDVVDDDALDVQAKPLEKVEEPPVEKQETEEEKKEREKLNAHRRIKERQASKSAEAKQQTKQNIIKKNKEEEAQQALENEPLEWPRLCKSGRQQSPINLDMQKLVQKNMKQPILDYHVIPDKLFLTYDGFQIKLLTDDQGFGVLVWNGVMYSATEVNFHTPSEHTLGPNHFKMDCEIQIIHKSAESDLLVLVLFLHNTFPTERSEFLESIGMPAEKNVNYRSIKNGELILIQKEVTLNELLPDSLGEFLAYTGSLTTPPCIENVQYLIKRSRIPVSTTQIQNLQRLQGSAENSRPIQNLNGRSVYTN